MGIQGRKYLFSIMDGLGHRDCITNIITGTLTLTVCLMVIAAAGVGKFEASLSRTELTYERALLDSMKSVKHLIVGVAKMDSLEKLDCHRDTGIYTEVRIQDWVRFQDSKSESN